MSTTTQVDKGKLKNNKNSKISKQHHIIEATADNGETQFNCTACRKTFRSRSQRYYHINCNQLQNLVYKCDHCDKSFARLTQWKYHIESHISPINECHKCQKTFSNPLALKKHVALHMVEPKLCPHCDKTFKKKVSLDQHIAAQHLNQLQYGCAYCSKKYASKSTLQLHLQTHEKKRFECTFCGKLFQRNSILNLHLKRHYKTNCYNCTVCQKMFSESGALARHRKIHGESVMQYYCTLCDKIILRKDNMTRHLNTIHPEEKFDNIVNIIKPTKMTKLQGNLGSEECDLYFTNQDTISDKKMLITENKLVLKSFEEKKSIVDLPNKIANIINTVEQPLIKHINVITSVPTYKNEIFTNNIENTQQEFIKHYKQTNHQQQEDSIILIENQGSCYKNSIRIIENCDLIKMQSNNVEQNKKSAENIAFGNNVPPILDTSLNQTEQQTEIQDFDKKQGCAHTNELETFDTFNINQHQSVKNLEPTTTESFSSVIRTVGNVKKTLTSHIVAPTKSINQTSLDYKHKKYCRNNYNIDLYRKILGCDEDDGDEVVEKQHKFDHMLTPSTPVHWRKCFKNNYETSAS